MLYLPHTYSYSILNVKELLLLPVNIFLFVGHWTGFQTRAGEDTKNRFTVYITVTGDTFTGNGQNRYGNNSEFSYVAGQIKGSLFTKSTIS